MLIHAIAHGGCTDTVRQSALEGNSRGGGGGIKKNPLPHWGLKPASILRLVFQSDALPTELSPP